MGKIKQNGYLSSVGDFETGEDLSKRGNVDIGEVKERIIQLDYTNRKLYEILKKNDKQIKSLMTQLAKLETPGGR